MTELLLSHSWFRTGLFLQQLCWPIRLRTIRSAPPQSLLITSGIFQGNYRGAIKPFVECS
jgi:hypothetical protein